MSEPHLPADTDEHADVVIVGSGPAGAAYARVLTAARPRARVLMVEAGPAVTDPPGAHLANLTDPAARERAAIAAQGPHQYRYPVAAASAVAQHRSPEERARALLARPGLIPVNPGDPGDPAADGFPAAQQACNVGGMGSHWFGASPRPDRTERIPFLDPALLDDALATAERLLDVSNARFHGSTFATHLRKTLGADLDEGRAPERRVQPMPMAVRDTPDGLRRCGTDVVLGDLATGTHPHFELRPGTLCERVLTADGRALGVRLRERATGRTYRVRAEHVVVAADPLRTPQLLYASGIRPAALGRHLNEHSQVSLLAEVDLPELDTADAEPAGRAPVMSDSAVSTLATSGVTWIPYDAERYPFHGMLTRIDPATLARPGSPPPARPVLSVHLFTAQEPRWDNRVEFSDTDLDWLGMPAMTIHHTLGEEDRAVLRRARAEALRLSALVGGPLAGESPWVLPGGSSLHYQGTVRMGAADDGTSVCDPACRVWGLENLYLAGGGVIPTRTACNPTLTSLALAVIGARDLARRLPDTTPPPAAAPGTPEGRTA